MEDEEDSLQLANCESKHTLEQHLTTLHKPDREQRSACSEVNVPPHTDNAIKPPKQLKSVT